MRIRRSIELFTPRPLPSGAFSSTIAKSSKPRHDGLPAARFRRIPRHFLPDRQCKYVIFSDMPYRLFIPEFFSIITNRN